MLEELQKYDTLGSKNELIFLLFKILSTTEYKTVDNVKTICIHHSYTFGTSFYGAVHLMKLLSIIQVNNKGIKAEEYISSYESESFFEKTFIYEKLFQLLLKENKLDVLFNGKTIKQNNETQQYYIRGNQIPFYLNCIKKFLINTGFLELIENTHNLYSVKESFRSFFTSFIVNRLKKDSEKRKMSLTKLKELQDIQNKYGEEAESFVLNFELDRLFKHPSKKSIKIISQEFSNAGYDIESFSSEDSIFNDKFIEVKSYNEDISFYWSRNEFETAKKLGDLYYIYLVDRKQMNNIGYKPIEIQNPYKNILKNDNWFKQVDKYKIDLNSFK